MRSRPSGSRRSSLPDRSVDLLVVLAVTAAAVMPMPFLAQARGLEPAQPDHPAQRALLTTPDRPPSIGL